MSFHALLHLNLDAGATIELAAKTGGSTGAEERSAALTIRNGADRGPSLLCVAEMNRVELAALGAAIERYLAES